MVRIGNVHLNLSVLQNYSGNTISGLLFHNSLAFSPSHLMHANTA